MSLISRQDVVRESSEFRVTDQSKPVKLLRNSDENSTESFDPITVLNAFDHTVENFPDRNAFLFKDEITKEWVGITFKEYKKRVEMMAKVFINLGLERHGVVAVLAFNCVEWFIAELAAIHAGLVSCPSKIRTEIRAI